MRLKTLCLFLLLTAINLHLLAQKSLNFDGVNDYVQTNYAGVLGSANRTFEAWINIRPGANRYMTILDYGVSQVGSRNTLGLNSSNGNFNFVSGGMNANMNALGAIKNSMIGTWLHAAFVLNNGTGYLYLNGVQVDSANLSTVNTPSGNASIKIGDRVAGGGPNYFDGSIAEVRIWDAALSQQEIQDWMCKYVSSSHPKILNLQAYWKMSDGIGTSVSDSSGNNRTGTIQNGAVWQNFGAPVGDVSSNLYGSTGKLSLPHPDGDSLWVDSVQDNPDGYHLYRRNGEPNYDRIPSSVSVYDSSRHWGVFMVGGTQPKAKLRYAYSANSHYQNNASCSEDLLIRDGSADSTWSATNSIVANGVASFEVNGSKEVVLAYNQGLSVSILSFSGLDTTIACVGDTVSLQTPSSGLTYQWMKDGQIINGATTSNFDVSTTGNYQLIAQKSTCSDTSNTLRVEFGAKPTVTLHPFQPVCASEFSITVSGGQPAGGSYSATYLSGNQFIVQTAGPGLHPIVYEYSSGSCSDTAIQYLEVLALPNVSLASKNAVCIDSASHALTGGMPLGGTYELNGVAASSFDPTALGAGSHKIKYTFTDTNNCSNSDSVQAVVHDLPVVTFTASMNRFCEYDADWSIGGENPVGGVFSGTGVRGSNFSPQNAGPGNYTINYAWTDPSTGCKNSAQDQIDVIAKPSQPTISNNGSSLQSSSADYYEWHFVGAGMLPDTNQVFNPIEKGDYTVRVRINGCWSDFADTVTFIPAGVNELWLANSVKIYPNPVADVLQVEVQDDDHFTINLLSLSGQVILQTEANENAQIDVQGIASGTYLLQIKVGEEVLNQKLLIE